MGSRLITSNLKFQVVIYMYFEASFMCLFFFFFFFFFWE